MNTPIGSLNLKIGDMLGYWFDSGDDWWHQINVIDIRDEALLLEYPKITKNEVANPPQYTD